MLMEKMASDIALAAELKLYKIAAEGEKEAKKPKAPKAQKSPAPAKAPKAAQPPKSDGGAKPPINAGQEKDLKARMMNNINSIRNSKLPAYMENMTLGAGMVPPGARGLTGQTVGLAANPIGAMETAANDGVNFTDSPVFNRLMSNEYSRESLNAATPESLDINFALNNALTSQHENDYRNKIRNLLGFDF